MKLRPYQFFRPRRCADGCALHRAYPAEQNSFENVVRFMCSWSVYPEFQKPAANYSRDGREMIAENYVMVMTVVITAEEGER